MLLRAPVRLLRARNNVLDLAFYDVDTLPAAARADLLRWSDPDGSIVVVHPLAGEARTVRHFEHVDEFVGSPDARGIDVAVVAGVGSSAIGTAALAANVADAIGRPVAGIVSGYGLADVIGEALSGWFVLRTANQLRQFVDCWLAAFEPWVAAWSRATQPNGDPWRLVSYVRGLPESDTLAALLAGHAPSFSLLVGHSKGNLSIAEAVAHHALRPGSRTHLHVVTFGALVHLPANAARRQYLGLMDGFGLMNSVLPQLPTWVPFASHSCNTRAPFALDVRATLVAAGIGTAQAVPAPRAATPLAWQEFAAGAAIALGAAMQESVRSVRQALSLA